MPQSLFKCGNHLATVAFDDICMEVARKTHANKCFLFILFIFYLLKDFICLLI